MTRSLCLAALVVAMNLLHLPATDGAAPRIGTRVFFQDDDAATLCWADVTVGDNVSLAAVQKIDGFPTLDSERQSLVQMEAASGMLLVGVRDDDDGTFQSGWVLIDTGVDEEVHGDHSHWHYPRPPRVRAAHLDDSQGNPAHLYCYDDVFYLANDQLDGYTRLDPRSIQPGDTAEQIRRKAVFVPGGGGHITLAVVNKTLGFATWIDREGPNKGRVDITPIGAGAPKIALSFHLSTGGLHGATTNQGKVFLAPADGVCWLDATSWQPGSPQPPVVQHLSLGKVDDQPLRTGSFAVSGRYVGCVTGAGNHAAVCLTDAAQSQMAFTRVPLSLAEGNRPVGPSFVQPRRGSPLAFVFHDHPADVEAPNRLTVLEVDPDGDGNWGDARVAQELDVGKARVSGHFGHHDITFDADRRWAVMTNPGDGTLVVLSLPDVKPIGEFRVGGAPSKVLAVGGRGSAR